MDVNVNEKTGEKDTREVQGGKRKDVCRSTLASSATYVIGTYTALSVDNAAHRIEFRCFHVQFRSAPA